MNFDPLVRRQINWNRFRFEQAESLAHLLFQFKQRLCGVASAGVRLFFV